MPMAASPMLRWLATMTPVRSSAAHARFLAHVLSEELGLPARFTPTGALAAAALVLGAFTPVAAQEEAEPTPLVLTPAQASGGCFRGRRR